MIYNNLEEKQHIKQHTAKRNDCLTNGGYRCRIQTFLFYIFHQIK